MPTGLLVVDGTLDLAQFWPIGKSDADTSKILVQVSPGAFRYRANPNVPFQNTHAFDDSKVVGQGSNKCIVNGVITVRLQGIDAPELHYRPQAALKKIDQSSEQHTLYLKWNLDFRQYFAETSTIALHDQLTQVGQNPIPCQVLSLVDNPGEVFDTYGRFVGDIVVTLNGQPFDVNTWLVESGWAFPAFYSSMNNDEITTLITATEKAYAAGAGVWSALADYAGSHDGAFDFDLTIRKVGSQPDPANDQGPVVAPKIYRRLAAYSVNKRAKMVFGSFHKYLVDRPDKCFLTQEFLDLGITVATQRQLDEFVQSDGFVNVWPEELTFQEKSSSLVGPNGPVTNW